jgi:hypothetical protein
MHWYKYICLLHSWCSEFNLPLEHCDFSLRHVARNEIGDPLISHSMASRGQVLTINKPKEWPNLYHTPLETNRENNRERSQWETIKAAPFISVLPYVLYRESFVWANEEKLCWFASFLCLLQYASFPERCSAEPRDSARWQ